MSVAVLSGGVDRRHLPAAILALSIVLICPGAIFASEIITAIAREDHIQSS